MPASIKAVIFGLLMLDVSFFAARDDASSTLDAIAWLLLLALFSWETNRTWQRQGDRLGAVIHAIRFAAAAAVVLAALAFASQASWLDFANSCLWIGVVALLEVQVRYPWLVARTESTFLTLAALLYGGLAVLVVVWAWRGEWLDAYDALLWIPAFMIIEMDMLRFSRRTTGSTSSPDPAQTTGARS
jgi:hypothetical protein